MIRFYFHPTPNPAKIALFLEEAGLPYEAIPVDTSKGEQHSPSFRTINPNGKVPVIVDSDGPDGDDHSTRRCGDRPGGRGVTITPPACGRGTNLSKEPSMTKVLVLYYSSYGHIEQMVDAMAEGAREGGAEVDIRRVPETAPPEVVKAAGFKADTAHPVIESVNALADYDATIIGAPTRFGRMPSQMAAFLDTAGGLWASGKLNGKVGGAFTSTATQHGGQETTLFSIITNLLHFGLTVVGLDGPRPAFHRLSARCPGRRRAGRRGPAKRASGRPVRARRFRSQSQFRVGSARRASSWRSGRRSGSGASSCRRSTLFFRVLGAFFLAQHKGIFRVAEGESP